MLKIFNTLTKKKEIFIPICEKIINIYVCGITVYDHCHIGHARTFTIFDMIIKYLRYCKYKVQYIYIFIYVFVYCVITKVNKYINIWLAIKNKIKRISQSVDRYHLKICIGIYKC